MIAYETRPTVRYTFKRILTQKRKLAISVCMYAMGACIGLLDERAVNEPHCEINDSDKHHAR